VNWDERAEKMTESGMIIRNEPNFMRNNYDKKETKMRADTDRHKELWKLK
jgi:hypothetical protein